MDEELQRILMGRMLGGPNATIQQMPEPSTARQILEFLTGYPADPMRDVSSVEVMLAGLPYAHKLKHLRRIAGGYGKVPLYHGTTMDNAKKIMEEGIKLPREGMAAVRQVLSRYGLGETEWKKMVQGRRGLTAAGYGTETSRLSTAPYQVAERWAKHFPQGEILSQFNAEARILQEAKKRGISYNQMYNQAHEAAREAAQRTGDTSLRNQFKVPDIIGAEDLMKQQIPGGAILEAIVNGADIPERYRREALAAIRITRPDYKYREPVKDMLKSWNQTYQDIKLDPQRIQQIRIVKGNIPPEY